MDPTSQPDVSRRSVLAGAAAGTTVAVATISDGQAQAPSSGTAVYVLVHPAWHGGWCWKKVTALLQARGHDVRTPTLTGLGERAHLARPDVGLDAHVQDIVNVLEYEDLAQVVLVGHSSSGIVITGVADRAPERIGQLIYLDAFVPQDGQSLLDLVPPDRRQGFEALIQGEGQGWLVPRFSPAPWATFVPEVWRVSDAADLRWMLARLRPTPVGHFKDPVRRRNAAAEALPHTYIRCTRYHHPGFDGHAEMARRTANWRCRELATFHHPAVTDARELADLLLALA